MTKQFWALYSEPYRKFAVFKGRARRAEYWVFVLTNTLISWALTSVDIAVGSYRSDFGMGLLGALMVLIVVVPTTSVTVRRLHDSGLSGVWFFVVFIPIAGPLVQLIQMVRRGTRGPNQYGPDSLGEILVDMPDDGGPPYATSKGRFDKCPWCGQSNPLGRENCQWCHKAYRELQRPA